VYRLDPITGESVAEIETSSPTRLLATKDGVWLTSFDQGVVERIDPASNEVVFGVLIGGNPNGITEGFGSVRVSDTGTRCIHRFDPIATGIAP
jgi:streptogramin lyase